MKNWYLAALLILILAGPAAAAKYDITDFTNLADDTFAAFIHEAGSAAAYRGLAPAEPEGLTGFDLGVAVSFVDIRDKNWQDILEGQDAPSYLTIPSLRLRKGLPFNLDVGAFYAQVPDSNVKLIGGEVQWALLEGGVASPALAIRANYSTLRGVDDFDLQTYGADAVISKGFAMLTPYAGVGVMRIKGEYTGNDPVVSSTLKDHSFTDPRYFAGVQVSLALLRLTLDAEYLERPVYSLKVSLGW